jgi:hypothetical protein
MRLMASDDRGTPSSSRVIGALIFIVLGVSLAAITAVLLWKIVVTNDQINLSTVVTAITKFGWLYMILAATALSLYGINVWKYIAQIRAGGFLNEQMQNGGMYNQMNPMNPYGGMGMGGMGGGMYPRPYGPMQPGGVVGPMNPLNPMNNPLSPLNPVSPLINPANPIAQAAQIGEGGSIGTQIIKTQIGQRVEPHTDPIPPRIHTTEAGVGSDE